MLPFMRARVAFAVTGRSTWLRDPTASRLKALIGFDSGLVQDTAKISDLFSFAVANSGAGHGPLETHARTAGLDHAPSQTSEPNAVGVRVWMTVLQNGAENTR